MAQEFTRNRITLNASSGSELVIGSADSNVLKTVHTVPASAQDNVTLEIVTGTSVTENIEVSIYKNTDLVKTLAVVGGKKSIVEINNLQAGDLIKIKHPLSLDFDDTLLPSSQVITDGIVFKSEGQNTMLMSNADGSDEILLDDAADGGIDPSRSTGSIDFYHYYPSAGVAVYMQSGTWYMYDSATQTETSSVTDATYYLNALNSSYSDNWILTWNDSYFAAIAVDLDAKTLTTGTTTTSLDRGYGGYFPTSDPDVFITGGNQNSDVEAIRFSGTSSTTLDSVSVTRVIFGAGGYGFSDGCFYGVYSDTSGSYVPDIVKWDGTSLTVTPYTTGTGCQTMVSIPSRNEVWWAGYNGSDGAAGNYANLYKYDTTTQTFTKYASAISESIGFANMTTAKMSHYDSENEIWWIAGQTTSPITWFIGIDVATGTAKYKKVAQVWNGGAGANDESYTETYGSGNNAIVAYNRRGGSPIIYKFESGNYYYDQSDTDRTWGDVWGVGAFHNASETFYRFEDDGNCYLFDTSGATPSWRSSDTTAFSSYTTSSTDRRVLYSWVDDANNKLYYIDYQGDVYTFDINSGTGALSNNAVIGTADGAPTGFLNFDANATGVRPKYLASTGLHYYNHAGTVYAADITTDTVSYSQAGSNPEASANQQQTLDLIPNADTGTGYDWLVYPRDASTSVQYLRINATSFSNGRTDSLPADVQTVAFVPWPRSASGNSNYPYQVIFGNGSTTAYAVDITAAATSAETSSYTPFDTPANLLGYSMAGYTQLCVHKDWHAVATNYNYVGPSNSYTAAVFHLLSPAVSAGGKGAYEPGYGGVDINEVADSGRSKTETSQPIQQSSAAEKTALEATYSTKTDGYVNRVTTTA